MDPKQRISIRDLVRHPWLLSGFNQPVSWRSKFKRETLDQDCVTELAVHYSKTVDDMRNTLLEVREELSHNLSLTGALIMGFNLLQWKYDYLTATYLLLLNKKSKGRPVRLLPRRVLVEKQRVNKFTNMLSSKWFTFHSNASISTESQCGY